MKIPRSLAVSLLLLACTSVVACGSVASAASAEAFVSPDTVKSTAVQHTVQDQSSRVDSTASGLANQRAAHSDAPADCVGPVSFCTPFFGS